MNTLTNWETQGALKNTPLEAPESAPVTAPERVVVAPERPRSPEIPAPTPENRPAVTPESQPVSAPVENLPVDNSLEVKKFTETTQKQVLSPIERRLTEAGYPFYQSQEAKQAARGSTRQATTWAGLSVARQLERERLLSRLGVTSDYLRVA
ncbi:hypothetical protein IJJ08_00745 [bacterium]|nr:hypothetical protein [bacterium]